MRRGFNPAMFIDTNVLVKSRIPNAPDHDVARISLDRAFRDPETAEDQPSGNTGVPGRRHSSTDLAGGYHP